MTEGMLRTEAAEILAAARKDMCSVVTMQAIVPWKALGQADSRNFLVQGAMGSAASVGLGLALARPNERVLVIDGDGSLLMQLGSLVSVGEEQPANFYHVVFNNGIYETSGGQDVPGRHRADLGAIALSSGYGHAYDCSSAVELLDNIDTWLNKDGPVFLSLRINGPGTVRLPHDFEQPAPPAQQIVNMRAALKVRADH